MRLSAQQFLVSAFVFFLCGMSARAEVLRDDLSVFAHVHPSGSASMAAMMMASNDMPGSESMIGMQMPTAKLPTKSFDSTRTPAR
ncbi:MAG: hypothetical protein ACLQBA_22660 [Candidatus Binataceae bacterium]